MVGAARKSPFRRVIEHEPTRRADRSTQGSQGFLRLLAAHATILIVRHLATHRKAQLLPSDTGWQEKRVVSPQLASTQQ
jgi:hypothetical protein